MLIAMQTVICDGHLLLWVYLAFCLTFFIVCVLGMFHHLNHKLKIYKSIFFLLTAAAAVYFTTLTPLLVSELSVTPSC